MYHTITTRTVPIPIERFYSDWDGRFENNGSWSAFTIAWYDIKQILNFGNFRVFHLVASFTVLSCTFPPCWLQCVHPTFLWFQSVFSFYIFLCFHPTNFCVFTQQVSVLSFCRLVCFHSTGFFHPVSFCGFMRQDSVFTSYWFLCFDSVILPAFILEFIVF